MKTLSPNNLYRYDYKLVDALKRKSNEVLLDIFHDKIPIKENEFKKKEAIKYYLKTKKNKLLTETLDNIKLSYCEYILDEWNYDFKEICKKEFSIFELVSILNQNAKEKTLNKFLKFATSIYGNQIERINICEVIKESFISKIILVPNSNDFNLTKQDKELQYYQCYEKFYDYYFQKIERYDLSCIIHNSFNERLHQTKYYNPLKEVFLLPSVAYYILLKRGYKFNCTYEERDYEGRDGHGLTIAKENGNKVKIYTPNNLNVLALFMYLWLPVASLMFEYIIRINILLYFSVVYASFKKLLFVFINNQPKTININYIDYSEMRL